MLIRCGYDIAFTVPAPTPIVACLSLLPERERDLTTPHVMTTDNGTALHHYRDLFGNVCTRALMPAGTTTFSLDITVRDSGLPDPRTPDAEQHAIEHLPDDTLVYLLASRYCETDAMMDIAWPLFGRTKPGWDRVQTIVAAAHDRVRFDYKLARPTRTALDAWTEQVGVCRDYAHLAVALCRAMNIPARYCTGWLGDIACKPVDGPMDFSAWFQVFLGGRWHTFDARHNVPRVGRVLMATGRDAADVALTTTFGPNELTRFDVVCDEVVGAGSPA